jgi:hypothetical protein
MSDPTCPVCRGKMVVTANPVLFRCTRKSVWHPAQGTQLEYTHAFVMVDGDDFPFMQIEVPPYTIKIIKDKNGDKSVISKTVPKTKHRLDKSKNKEYVYKELITVDAAINLPWHDRLKVLDRIMTYLIFS